ncbi:hypothetical protein AFL01nite_27780 [Aeromicrobium flavum]|uniref:Uncharacterized protein n=2 Tax=Aeromicrobium flavum TaxID=416568 RepID=A0A512HYC5_9ACTN|nr:hypothetical protein AFL01nite_27780 [Aeromicrobium flavum]
MGAALASIVAAWAVSYFGPGLWSEAKEAAGQDPLRVTVLASDEFVSPVEAEHRGEYVWPADTEGIRDRAAAWVAGEGALPPDEVSREEGAFDAHSTMFRLQLRASGGDTVTIHQFEVETQDRKPPLAGYWFTGDQGGVADVSYLSVSLDDEKVTWMDPQTGVETPPKTLEVTSSDQEYVDVLARATDCACTWRLRLGYTTSDGDRGELVVGPSKGQSFRTTGLGSAASVHLTSGCTMPAGARPDLCAGL